MHTITTRDAAALMEIAYEGATEDGREPFPSRVLAAIARLIPSDAFVGYEEAEFVGGFRVIEEVDVVGGPPTPAMIEILREWSWQNPMSGHLHAQKHRVLRLSDFLTPRERRTLEFEAMVWRAYGIDDALRVWLPADGNRVRSIYLERSGKNYSDRERGLLELLRPHLVRMCEAARFRRCINADELTPRESEVLGWVAKGKTNPEVGQLLFISAHTVRKHLENIFEKLGVTTRTAAAAQAKTQMKGTLG
jgi:DNA-binding CsgD family transcriptional regulator